MTSLMGNNKHRIACLTEKHRGRLLIAALLLIALAVPVWAENWVKFSEDNSGYGYFIDTDSITYIGNNRVSVWIIQDGDPLWGKDQYFIDFSYRTYMLVSTLCYNKDGTLAYDFSSPNPAWHPIDIGVSYRVYKFLESWLK